MPAGALMQYNIMQYIMHINLLPSRSKQEVPRH